MFLKQIGKVKFRECNEYMKTCSNKLCKIVKRFVKEIVILSIILLLLLCFEPQISDMIWIFNNKWISRCNDTYGGFAILLLLPLLVCYLHSKWRNKIISAKHIMCLIGIILVYLYYRLGKTDKFTFWGFTFQGIYLAYLDFYLITIIQLVCYHYLRSKKNSKVNSKGNCILENDEPIESIEDDLFGYDTIIRTLLSDLDAINLSKHSYSIGIAGEWGLGKTSFFNVFKNILESDNYRDNSIIVHFNPRMVTEIKNIQREFFDKFASAIAHYHSNIASDIQRYQDALALPESNFVVRLLRLLPSLTVSKSKDAINDVINDIGRRVYVFIDDFDRLTAKEILEVMKFVDRNGDFQQTVFITAYDKEYVNDVLRNYLKFQNKDAFTDKYFNYELLLPVQSKEILVGYVKDSLKKIEIEKDDVITVSLMQAEWDKIALQIVEQLRTLRNIKRFLNIFVSRYKIVRNDVFFSDFVRVSLLRYYDITCYQALVEGKLTQNGGLLSDNIYYRVDNIEEKLMKYAKWEGSKDIIFELLKEEQQNEEYDMTTKYRRLQFVQSFPCYFYDYQPKGLYHKQLIELYNAKTDKEAIDYFHILVKYDKEKKQYDLPSYVSVENFLRIRPLSELRDGNDVIRLFILLIYLNEFKGESLNVEQSLIYMMGRECAEELSNNKIIVEQKYKDRLSKAIESQIKQQPFNFRFAMLINHICNSMSESDVVLKKYLFSKEDMQKKALLGQKSYISKTDSITSDNVAVVVFLSKVFKEKKDGKKIIADAAKREFVSFISHHADDFLKSCIKIEKIYHVKPKLLLSLIHFEASYFFPCENVDFNDWIKNIVKRTDIAYLFNRLYNETNKKIQIDLHDNNIDVNDYTEVYKLVKASDELSEESVVLDAMQQHVANSIELLSKQTNISKKNVVLAIKRMKDKGKLTGKQARIAETIPEFKKGDFVWVEDKVKDMFLVSSRHIANLFEIVEVKGNNVRLKDVEGTISLYKIEAVPIDGIHDINIYYDPIVAASLIPSGGKVPVHTSNFSYYMENFKKHFLSNNKSYSDIVKERNYHFVHEVQHWLRTMNDNGLKINKYRI